eukprot:SM004827S16923  [mRNA]  locus=s4827:61:273:+ [translate_table: standard]
MPRLLGRTAASTPGAPISSLACTAGGFGSLPTSSQRTPWIPGALHARRRRRTTPSAKRPTQRSASTRITR